ncbi:alpha/beta hydrolase [Accumulibacter sp.]|uniref:Alpha/beta hydrolase n=1 Tax=Accumulibacter regalis TaxID=522306 RepID=C7RUI6_ACCRE|nr:alpha/beta hydrolase [Accumulibacter sp.]MBN8499242.1 alpha/beta hydrolase [Accumulibacter sp.]MBO3714974.1 alpha/beta hydrolase [Accumulibacter sp.]
MLIATTRNLESRQRPVVDHGNQPDPQDWFGEEFGDGLRFAMATPAKGGSDWDVRLLVEEGSISSGIESALRAPRGACVCYVHGINKRFEQTLEQASEIERSYGVDVFLFSWPSFIVPTANDPEGLEGLVERYRRARRNAEASGDCFDDFLQRIVQRAPPRSTSSPTVNLLLHSEGNFLLESYIKSAAFSGDEVRAFTNIILSQADLDYDGHRECLNRLASAGSSVYVTINTNDSTLRKAEKPNDGKRRLGNTRPEAVGASASAQYFDFTGGQGVGDTHRLWDTKTINENPVVSAFFSAILTGKAVEADPTFRAQFFVLSQIWPGPPV